MGRGLEIRIGGNTAGLTAAVNSAITQLGRVDREAARTAAVQQREAIRTAAVQQREAERAASAQVQSAQRAAQAAQRAAETAQRAADAQARNSAKAAAAQQRDAERTASVQSRASQQAALAAQRAADAQAKASATAALAAQRLADTQAREAQRAAIVMTREAERVAAAQARSARQAARVQEQEARRAASTVQGGFSLSALAAGQLKDAVFGIVGQFTLLSAAQAGLAAITGMWDQWKRDSLEAAKNIGDVREQLLELAALKGRLGDTTTENAAQLGFRTKTLQTAEAARMFQGQFLNVSDPLVGKRISKDESNKLMEKAGLFQAAEGGDASTHASLAGIMPALMGKDNVTADEAFAAELKTYNQMQKGGFTFSSGAKQLVDKQALVTSGVFKDQSRMVGMLSAISNVVSPDQAGTTLEQIVDATTGSLRRMRQGKMDGDTQPASEYYKSIGADDQMDPAAIAEKVFKDFDREKAAEKTKGRDFNSWTYLQGKGFMNREAITGLMAAYGSYENGQWQGHMNRAASTDGLTDADRNDPNFINSTERLRQFNTSPVADTRRVDIAKGQQNTINGLPTEGYRKMQEMAFLNLKSRGEASGDDFKGYAESNWAPNQRKLDREIARMMAETAKKKGVNFDPRSVFTEAFDVGGFSDYGPSRTGETRAKRFQEAQAQIDGTNPTAGSVMASFSEELRKLTEATTANTKAMEDQRAGKTPAVIPSGAGPAGPMRKP